MRLVLLILLALVASNINAQAPTACFNLDCNLKDQSGNYEDIFAKNALNCDCGVQGDALRIHGSLDSLRLDTTLTKVLDGDFGISFYFKPDVDNNALELLSIGNNCSSDSTFRVYYLKDINEVRVEVNESVLQSVTLNGKVNTSRCWHHVILTRANNKYELYLDGELKDVSEEAFEARINFSLPMTIGYGPCNGLLTSPFQGYMDELKFFNQQIQPYLVDILSLPYESIITADTTIFKGDFIDVKAEVNCSGNISWSPSKGLESTNQFETKLEGIETTSYIATFEEDNCIATDTLTVRVIDKSDIDCSKVILPNVFSPNGDGLNDEIGILNYYIIDEFEFLQIFDRWGELVFETNDKTARWDGSFKGRAVNSNTFVYKLRYTCSGEAFTSTGSFTILR